MNITIKAAVADAIRMLQHRRETIKEVKNKTKSIKKELNKLSKKELIDTLNSIDTYSFSENCIYYDIALTDEEKIKEIESIKQGIKYDIHRLKKWLNHSSENKEQILIYLSYHNITIKGINC